MNELLNQPKREEPPKLIDPLTDSEYLRQIAERLKSIRTMLSFFTALAILAIVLQACSVLSLV